ncbi:MAG TPA: CoA-transferase [Burkholderiales bacterium]|nr:CoA-transferase [Burkholderiales bacterium]
MSVPAGQSAYLVATIARLLHGRRHIAVGANLPIPASAALLARRLSAGRMRLDILGSRKFDSFGGLGGMFDCACQGRFDGFFLSPGQIDGHGNINLVGVGDYPRLKVRWPGSHGSALLYMMIPNIILFRDTHLKRALVPKVDFISATGTSPPNVYRPGGPGALVTSMAHFAFDRAAARFRLESVHLGHTLDDIVENTGFDFDRAEQPATTPLPDAQTLDLIEGEVSAAVAEIYPQFAPSLSESAAALRERIDKTTRRQEGANA